MKPHHILLLACYATFLVGMIAGAGLARNPPLWVAMIVLVALVIGLMGYFTAWKPKKKKLPTRRNVRLVR
jgi:hypothetical protein